MQRKTFIGLVIGLCVGFVAGVFAAPDLYLTFDHGLFKKDEDGDDEEIEIRIVGTYSIPSEDAESGNWPTETVSITEWEINEIL